MKMLACTLGVLGALGSLEGCRAQSSDMNDSLALASPAPVPQIAPQMDDLLATMGAPLDLSAVPAPSGATCAENTTPLSAKAWVSREIQTLAVINSLGDPADPKPVPANMSQFKVCTSADDCAAPDLVVNGAFHARQGLVPVKVAGATMRHGIVDAGAPSYTLSSRGGVALLDNGQIVVCRPLTQNPYVSADDIQKNCALPGTQVTDFMGGGAYLVRNGYKACSGQDVKGNCDQTADLAKVQDFNQEAPGIKSEQMHAALHMVMAIRQGKAFVLWPVSALSAQQIQDQLCAAGFDQVVMYDGGSGFVVFGKGVSPIVGINPTAFLIKTKL